MFFFRFSEMVQRSTFALNIYFLISLRQEIRVYSTFLGNLFNDNIFVRNNKLLMLGYVLIVLLIVFFVVLSSP